MLGIPKYQKMDKIQQAGNCDIRGVLSYNHVELSYIK